MARKRDEDLESKRAMDRTKARRAFRRRRRELKEQWIDRESLEEPSWGADEGSETAERDEEGEEWE